MVKAGVYLMARTVSSGWAMSPKIAALMAGMALLTIFVALSFYFVQDDLKRLLAYSTIAHLGYVLLGVAIGALGSNAGLSRRGFAHSLPRRTVRLRCSSAWEAFRMSPGRAAYRHCAGWRGDMPLTATAFLSAC